MEQSLVVNIVESYWLVVVLLIVAAIANAIMDVLQFHYSKSVFAKDSRYNPKESWKNKWKLDAEGNVIPGVERFWLSSTVLVFLTDWWHFAQTIMLTAFTGAIVIYTPIREVWWLMLLDLILFKIIFGVVFELFFSKILIVKK